MNVDQFIDLVKVIRGPIQTPITSLTNNSKKVQKGSLFIAEKGVANDGHKYLLSAIDNGATSLLVENIEAVPADYPGLVLQASNTRAVAPLIANRFYQKPSEKLFAVGITGTNGKTSLTYLLEHFFNEASRPTGVIGTIDHHLGERQWPTEMTTPHPIELQQRLSEFIEAGAKTLAIEVSSHAIDQKRIEGIEFDVGIFTNLTRDHLDYHSNMEEYFEVKKSFLTSLLSHSRKSNVFAIINNDDPWGAKIQPPASVKTWRYGATQGEFTFELEKMDFQGTHFKLKTPFGTLSLHSPLVGIHNIYNVMAAVAAALAGGLSPAQIEKSLLTFKGIPGRLQLVPNTKNVSVVVDYAHSPDALENVLTSIRKVLGEQKTSGRIICVFGCGGDRDKGKRPLMAKVADEKSNVVIVTSDNPRTEDPLQIINEILVGFQHQDSNRLHVEPDRAKAIAQAIEMAQPDDVILIAGKGHEDYQIIGKEKFYFSDYETARKLLS